MYTLLSTNSHLCSVSHSEACATVINMSCHVIHYNKPCPANLYYDLGLERCNRHRKAPVFNNIQMHETATVETNC